MIVDDDGELVRGSPVFLAHDKIAEFRGQIAFDLSRTEIVDLVDSIGDAKPPREFGSQ